MMKLSTNEKQVLDYLKGKEYVSPTQIGCDLNGIEILRGLIKCH